MPQGRGMIYLVRRVRMTDIAHRTCCDYCGEELEDRVIYTKGGLMLCQKCNLLIDVCSDISIGGTENE